MTVQWNKNVATQKKNSVTSKTEKLTNFLNKTVGIMCSMYYVLEKNMPMMFDPKPIQVQIIQQTNEEKIRHTECVNIWCSEEEPSKETDSSRFTYLSLSCYCDANARINNMGILTSLLHNI